jgi:glutamate N-acetyltransferase / amino-acid N-acetyltransferase
MSVTFAGGFRASSVTAGLKPSGRPDLALLVGDPGTTVAGLFTTNSVAAAPVVLSRSRLAAGSPRAVLVNSGQANAATGPRGEHDALVSTAAAAAALGIAPEEVLQCSTGVIGEPLHMEQLIEALPKLVAGLGTDGGDGFAEAILTTDTVEKTAATKSGPFRIGGCAKGVGMIAPSLATMLAFITTDAPVGPEDLTSLAADVLAPAFNSLIVDGCTSTNDTVLLFSSGAAGGDPVFLGSPAWHQLSDGLSIVATSLARSLIADGEGAGHVLIVDVDGAGNDDQARTIAKAVAGSMLVKTAAFGGDPNPGRILQAAGAAGVALDASAIDVEIGGVRVAQGGVIPSAYFDDERFAAHAREAMGRDEIGITVRVGAGPGRSRALGCDLSYDYVRINGEYTT